MLAEIGLAALVLAFLLSIYATALSLLGARYGRQSWLISGRSAALLTFPALLLSTLLLVIALLTEQYQLSYVWSVTDPQTPLMYRFTALWGSQRGLAALLVAAAQRFQLRRHRAELADERAAHARRYRDHDGDAGVLPGIVAGAGEPL